MKAVFDTSSKSIYDDDIVYRYHFPPRYLDLVSKCSGDWIVFRQPRAAGGSKCYFAVARVVRVEPDPNPNNASFHYAIMGDFFPFDRLVAWSPNGRYAEAALRNIPDVSSVGLYLRGRSVRPLDEADFVTILLDGLPGLLNESYGEQLDVPESQSAEILRPLTLMSDEEKGRRIEQVLLNRKLRDARFRTVVCLAYENRCAFTGLKITDKTGRAEVQAAHILPVADEGPDTIQNGIALCATAHWMFDRHLISLNDDYSVMMHLNYMPSDLCDLFRRQTNRVLLPKDPRFWPSQKYLAIHRDKFLSTK